jgi:hypothetical protein
MDFAVLGILTPIIVFVNVMILRSEFRYRELVVFVLSVVAISLGIQFSIHLLQSERFANWFWVVLPLTMLIVLIGTCWFSFVLKGRNALTQFLRSSEGLLCGLGLGILFLATPIALNFESVIGFKNIVVVGGVVFLGVWWLVLRFIAKNVFPAM